MTSPCSNSDKIDLAFYFYSVRKVLHLILKVNQLKRKKPLKLEISYMIKNDSLAKDMYAHTEH